MEVKVIFLGIEVVEIPNVVCLSQRKYCLELLYGFGMLGCKPVKTPLESNLNFDNNNDGLLENISDFQILVGKIIYLTITRPDIAYYVQLLS